MSSVTLARTKQFEVLDVLGVEQGGLGVRVEARLQQVVELATQGDGGRRCLEQVVQRPERQPERVVVDVQVDEVVALDLELVLAVAAHELDGAAQLRRQVGPGEQLAGCRTLQQLHQRRHGAREQLQRETEPQVVEVPARQPSCTRHSLARRHLARPLGRPSFRDLTPCQLREKRNSSLVHVS